MGYHNNRTEEAGCFLVGSLPTACVPPYARSQKATDYPSRRGLTPKEEEDFFAALYGVAASLTRWLPGALGNVSSTRCAGLTKPSSIAVAAWIASSSSIGDSSKRLRKWASTSGSTKCSWEPSTWTSLIPQASITARSVRNRLEICSSKQANSCLRRSHVHNTRVETGGRPRNHIGPLATGMRCGHQVGHLQARSTSGRSMLEIP